MRVSRGLGRVRRPVVVLVAAVLSMSGAGLALGWASAAQAAAGGGAGKAEAASIVRTKAQWQAAVAKVAEPGHGCYRASYPALQWHATGCAVAPKWPVAPALASGSATHAAPAAVGDGHDYSAVTTGLITQATGTFKDVSSGITEKGQEDHTGPRVKNAFTLQLNSQFFDSPACEGASDPSDCLGWQQFVYEYGGRHAGFIFMQYWLIDYANTCPEGWFTYSSDCYTNSSAAEMSSPLTAAELATLSFTGSAASGGNDTVSLSVGSGHAISVSGPDSMVDLSAFWNTAEWGVFGDGGGGEAFFGSDTTLQAQTAVTSGSSAAPSCVNEGFTAETNNLDLVGTSLAGQPAPTIATRQTNGKRVGHSCAAVGASDTSVTSLKLSSTKATYGHEGQEHLTVKVTSAATVTGKVTVTATAPKHKPVKVCVITLSSGAGSCTLHSKVLGVAFWKLTAAYGGTAGILTSDSNAKNLKVTK